MELFSQVVWVWERMVKQVMFWLKFQTAESDPFRCWLVVKSVSCDDWRGSMVSVSWTLTLWRRILTRCLCAAFRCGRMIWHDMTWYEKPSETSTFQADRRGEGKLKHDEFHELMARLMKLPVGQELPDKKKKELWISATQGWRKQLDLDAFLGFYAQFGRWIPLAVSHVDFKDRFSIKIPYIKLSKTNLIHETYLISFYHNLKTKYILFKIEIVMNKSLYNVLRFQHENIYILKYKIK